MADETTPNFGLTLPTTGMDRDVWGDLLNQDLRVIDAIMKQNRDAADAATRRVANLLFAVQNFIEPVGSCKPWPTPNLPPAFLPLDGQEYDRNQFAELFAVIGTYWGGGNGSTTFNVPNWQGYVPAHRGSFVPYVGWKGGEVAHQLSWEEMPAHNHGGTTDVQGNHNHGYDRARATQAPGYSSGYQLNIATDHIATDAGGNHAHNILTSVAGAYWAHNNVQPTVGVMWIMKYTAGLAGV